MKPTLSLIVNTYNQTDYLRRVLRGVSAQVTSPDEVLLADDGSDAATRELWGEWSAPCPFRVEHVWHAKDGFRRARILNAAIARARGDYIVFLDGDTIPHPHFVGDHRSLARLGYFVQGHRALISRRATPGFGHGPFADARSKAFWAGQIHGLKHVFRWPAPYKRVVPNLDGIRGCNLGIWRSDLVRVNGYNEEFVGWGCEDLDLAQRLLNCGIGRLDVRGWVLCYHLWHVEADRAHLAENQRILDETVSRRLERCSEGLNRHTTREPALLLGRPEHQAEQEAAGSALRERVV